MNLSPAMSVTPRYFRDGQLLPGAIGGNLARVVRNAPSLRRVAFLFLEQPQQFGAQFTNAGRVHLMASTSAPAGKRLGLPSSALAPLALPFIQVDHFTHLSDTLPKQRFLLLRLCCARLLLKMVRGMFK